MEEASEITHRMSFSVWSHQDVAVLVKRNGRVERLLANSSHEVLRTCTVWG